MALVGRGFFVREQGYSSIEADLPDRCIGITLDLV